MKRNNINLFNGARCVFTEHGWAPNFGSHTVPFDSIAVHSQPYSVIAGFDGSACGLTQIRLTKNLRTNLSCHPDSLLSTPLGSGRGKLHPLYWGEFKSSS